MSDSVDATEYRLQLGGLASAVLHPEVQSAFLAVPTAPVRLFVFEWAGYCSQRRIIDWQEIKGTKDLAWVAAILRSRSRFALVPSTGIGEAMLYGGGALADQPDCWRHILDLSGDGMSNAGILPRSLSAAVLGGVTVNGFVVGSNGENSSDEIANLLAYYVDDVIRGPDAFVEMATTYRDLEQAMTRKLLREMQALALSEMQGQPTRNDISASNFGHR